MSGRPDHPQRPGHDDLLGLDDHDNAIYNSGQPPPVGDQDLLREYNISNSSTAPPRVSTSHDDFVGASSTAGLPGGPGHATQGSSSSLQPTMLGASERKFSQTAEMTMPAIRSPRLEAIMRQEEELMRTMCRGFL
jgi:phospholipid-transporting ATPase